MGEQFTDIYYSERSEKKASAVTVNNDQLINDVNAIIWQKENKTYLSSISVLAQINLTYQWTTSDVLWNKTIQPCSN